MRHGSLFSGIRGFELAATWMGWENVFSCEINDFCNKVGKYHFTETIIHTDIKTTDFTPYANTIDILTGGFPCQPYSLAGKRKGKEDERHLWPEMRRAIREIQPRWVVGENVFGLINWSGGLVFHEVQADLEAEGYEVFPYVLPACAKNAPHRRDRIWFVAYAGGAGGVQFRGGGTVRNRERNGANEEQGRELQPVGVRGGDEIGPTTNTRGEQLQDGSPEYNGPDRAENGAGLDNWIERPGDTRDVTNSENIGHAGGKENNRGNPGEFHSHKSGWNKTDGGEPVGCSGDVTNTNGGQRCEGWMHKTDYGRGTWQNFPTQSPLCNGNDGFSERLDLTALSFSKWRNESIKAGGNAIVPQVAYEIFKAIEKYEQL